MPKYTVKRKQYPKRDLYAKKIYKIEKRINKIQRRMEVKFCHLSYANVVNFNGTVLSVMNNITNGTADSNQRIGDKINVKRFRLNYAVSESTSVANFGPFYARLVVYVDKENNLTLANSILPGAGSNTATISQFDWDLARNVTILKDKKFALSTSRPTHIGGFTINMKDLPVQYDSSTSIVLKNDIKVLWISDTDTAINLPTVKHFLRVEYFDS